MTEAFATGQNAENRALEFLLDNKLTVIERNYRCRRGEIDLVMEDNGTIVFVEVRYRKQSRFGSALESVTHRKQEKIIHAARHFLAHRANDKPARFDVMALSPKGDKLDIQWIKSAFET